MQDHLAEWIAPVKCQNATDGTAVLDFEHAVNVNWLSGVASKTVFQPERDHGGIVMIVMVVKVR